MINRREVLSGVAAGAVAVATDIEVFAQTEDGLVFETLVTDTGQSFNQATGETFATYTLYTPMTEEQMDNTLQTLPVPARDATPGINVYLYNVPTGVFEPGERLVVTIQRAV